VVYGCVSVICERVSVVCLSDTEREMKGWEEGNHIGRRSNHLLLIRSSGGVERFIKDLFWYD
jgi:hypothetical protein